MCIRDRYWLLFVVRYDERCINKRLEIKFNSEQRFRNICENGENIYAFFSLFSLVVCTFFLFGRFKTSCLHFQSRPFQTLRFIPEVARSIQERSE